MDPYEIYYALEMCKIETTAIILCSKSFQTVETLQNAKVALD